MARDVTPQPHNADATEARLALNKRVRRGLWILAVTLLVAGGLMCYLMAVVLSAAARTADPTRRDFLTKLAIICLLTVLWDFILLVWVAWRIIAYRLRPTRHAPTPYINAWALAGRRFRLRKSTPPADGEDENDEDNNRPNESPDWRGPT